MQVETIPASMRELRQWVCWKYEDRGGKPTKVPVTIGGYHASNRDPMDWYTFDECCEVASQYEGVGFVFTADDPFVGIDLDDCFASAGELKAWAVPIVGKLAGSYAEVSPSGDGLKVFCLGANSLPRGRKASVGDGSVEIYDQGRFFTVTSNAWDDADAVDKQEAIDWLTANYFVEKPKETTPFVARQTVQSSDKVDRARKYLDTMEPAIEGSGGHDAAFRAACKMVLGFDLDTETAFALLSNGYNSRCVPPWSEKELRHKVESANAETGDRGYLLTDSRQTLPIPSVDLSALIGEERKPDFDDEDFAQSMVPASGLLRDIYDFYGQTAQRLSHVMGLAVSVSTCEVLFGRRITSHTDLRTNDYNVIMAPTNCGKEACEKTISKIFDAVDPNNKFIIPPDVQSGNGLLASIADARCCIWVSDEFGKVLAAVLDKKNRNPHQTQIATHLLKLYGKADGIYGGAAHSAGVRHRIIQPHFCVLGLTTGSTLFESVNASNVSDGLFGRIAFWPVQDRPKRRRMQKTEVPAALVDKVRQWASWTPPGELGPEFPEPVMLTMDPPSLARWEMHSDAIDDRMDEESETRNAIWGRVAARSMKLAMVHRAARETADPSQINWPLCEIEMVDVEWGITVSNWLARIACQLITENFVDETTNVLCSLIEDAVADRSEVTTRDITRAYRKYSSGDVMAAAKRLEDAGKLIIDRKKSQGRGRPSFVMRSILSA